jgi:Spy/CpxP family protein refolding chaperone
MKRWQAAVAATAVVCTIAGTALAQPAQSDIAVMRAQIQADRQKLVADNLPLSDTQATAFWPVYREYRGEVAKLGDRMVAMVEDYALRYDTLTDDQAYKLTTEYMSIQKDTVKLREKYLAKFNAVLTPKLVMRFLQIENKLDTILMVAAVDGIPLVK